MNNTIYGYVRESDNQSVEKQILAIREYGVDESCVYKDKQEDAGFPAYHLLLERIRPGDTVVLKSLDRLGDSYDDILVKWEKITKDHDTAIVVLDMRLPDTAKALNGQFVSELVLDVLKYAERNQRILRRRRQSEGIRAAQERGVKFGSPSKQDPEEFQKVKADYERGALTVTGAAARLNISRATFRRWVSEARAEEGTETETNGRGLLTATKLDNGGNEERIEAGSEAAKHGGEAL
ncbi:MAG: recombinase family protein [Lachnospiraceae bacterium]|nr:recombinase family protein [Lachnospiraceae bacterium]